MGPGGKTCELEAGSRGKEGFYDKRVWGVGEGWRGSGSRGGAEGVPREALRASRETLANGCGCERKIRTRDSTCSGALSEERGVVFFVLFCFVRGTSFDARKKV